MQEALATRRFPTRREVLRILAVAGVVGGAGGFGLLRRRRSRIVERSRVLMGTGVHLTLVGDDPAESAAAADATLDRMADLESLLSRHRPDSEVSRLNDTGSIDGSSDALIDVLRLAEDISRRSGGAFDVTVQPLSTLYRDRVARDGTIPPGQDIERTLALVDHRAVRLDGRAVSFERPGMRITLDGVAKGYIVDRGVDVLKQRGFGDVLVEAGGDLVAAGGRAPDAPWRIGIRGPRSGLAVEARFNARDRAVATSGDYMQPFTPDYAHHHILDPRTGYSSPELASATVVASDAATADAVATAVMVLGTRAGRDLVESIPGAECYLVSKDLAVARTDGFTLARSLSE